MFNEQTISLDKVSAVSKVHVHDLFMYIHVLCAYSIYLYMYMMHATTLMIIADLHVHVDIYSTHFTLINPFMNTSHPFQNPWH